MVLFAGTTALFMQSAIALDPQAATMITFATMVMVFATLLVLRWLGAYHIRSLLQPARSTVLATSFSALAGQLVGGGVAGLVAPTIVGMIVNKMKG